MCAAAFGSCSRRARKIDDALVPQDCGLRLPNCICCIILARWVRTYICGGRCHTCCQGAFSARNRRQTDDAVERVEMRGASPFYARAHIYTSRGNPAGCVCVSALRRWRALVMNSKSRHVRPGKTSNHDAGLWASAGICGMKSKLQFIFSNQGQTHWDLIVVFSVCIVKIICTGKSSSTRWGKRNWCLRKK